MILILLSDSSKNDKEAGIVYDCFVNGLDVFHLRKKNFTFNEMENFIQQIPVKFHNRIIIHSHYKLAIKYDLLGIHFSRNRRKNKLKYLLRLWYYRFKKPNLQLSTSFHHLSSLTTEKDKYNYVFLSPIFDSISNTGFSSAFNFKMLQNSLNNSKHRVIALGGVNAERINQIKNLGFYGAAISGAIWESEDKTASFLEIKKQLNS